MENLIYDKEVTKSYDLKGSVRNRLITEGESQSSQVLPHHMMDYSLLAGICDKDNKLVVGIIDYIRTFTWDKKLET